MHTSIRSAAAVAVALVAFAATPPTGAFPYHVVPAGYTVATSAPLSAPAGVQTRGWVSCPAGTVVWSGGVLISSSDLSANINSSFPVGSTGWAADVDNGSPFATTFQVAAICAAALPQYTIQTGWHAGTPGSFS
jgi:hypothetical protein